jgi:hypothetical protein
MAFMRVSLVERLHQVAMGLVSGLESCYQVRGLLRPRPVVPTAAS